MTIIVACREINNDLNHASVLSMIQKAQLPLSVTLYSINTVSNHLIQYIQKNIINKRTQVKSDIINIGIMGVKDIMIDSLSINDFAYQIIKLFLLEKNFNIAISLVLFQPHHNIHSEGINITEKLFSNTLNGFASITKIIEYTNLIDLVKSSSSFRRVINISSLCLQIHLQGKETLSTLINIWWVQGLHINQFVYNNNNNKWWPSLDILVLVILDKISELEKMLISIKTKYENKIFSEQDNLSQIVNTENYLQNLQSELQELKIKNEEFQTFIKQQKTSNEEMKEKLHKLQETSCELISEQERLKRQRDVIQNIKRREEEEEEELKQEIKLLNESENYRIIELRKSLETEYKIEKDSLDSQHAYFLKLKEEEERKSNIQTEMIDKKLKTAHQQRESLLDEISQKKSNNNNNNNNNNNTHSREHSAKEFKSIINITEIELNRVKAQCYQLLNTRRVLQDELKDLQALQYYWNKKEKEDYYDNYQEDEYNNNNSNNNILLIKEMLIAEEKVAREALQAIESSEWYEYIELSCLYKNSKNNYKLHELNFQLRIPNTREQRKRELTLREIERIGRLKTVIRREIEEAQREGNVCEMKLQHHLQLLRNKKNNYLQFNNNDNSSTPMVTTRTNNNNGIIIIEEEVEVLQRIIQLLETSLLTSISSINKSSSNSSSLLSNQRMKIEDWNSAAEALIIQKQYVQEDLRLIKENINKLRWQLLELERNVATEEDTLEAIKLRKITLTWQLRRHIPDE